MHKVKSCCQLSQVQEKKTTKKSMKYKKNASLKVREMTSYQSGCSLVDHLSTDIQRIPAPLLQPEYQPVEIEQLKECHLAFIDVETTGLGRDSLSYSCQLV